MEDRTGPYYANIIFLLTLEGDDEEDRYWWEVAPSYGTFIPTHIGDGEYGLEYEADEFGLDSILGENYDYDFWGDHTERWLSVFLKNGWTFQQEITIRYWWCMSHMPSTPYGPEEWDTWIEWEELYKEAPTEEGMTDLVNWLTWATGEHEINEQNGYMYDLAQQTAKQWIERQG